MRGLTSNRCACPTTWPRRGIRAGALLEERRSDRAVDEIRIHRRSPLLPKLSRDLGQEVRLVDQIQDVERGVNVVERLRGGKRLSVELHDQAPRILVLDGEGAVEQA